MDGWMQSTAVMEILRCCFGYILGMLSAGTVDHMVTAEDDGAIDEGTGICSNQGTQ